SGHNEAVLKTVCPQGRVGSNPTLSVGDTFFIECGCFEDTSMEIYFNNDSDVSFIWRSTQVG
ncbi:MAG: hypothetical protein K2K21_02585, partial [Lachnospiraceae bacterium]|nr:hypothetical protein [Lachnospiraceae bacterium]